MTAVLELECVECGAPVDVAWSAICRGVDFDGSDALFELKRVNCVSGHWYDEVGEVVHDPLVGETLR